MRDIHREIRKVRLEGLLSDLEVAFLEKLTI